MAKVGNPAWVKGGPSPNPGGRVAGDAGDFAARCRRTARNMLDLIDRRLLTKDAVIDRDLIQAFADVCNRGGYLATNIQADMETNRARLILQALATATLTPEQRDLLIAELRKDPVMQLESPTAEDPDCARVSQKEHESLSVSVSEATKIDPKPDGE